MCIATFNPFIFVRHRWKAFYVCISWIQHDTRSTTKNERFMIPISACYNQGSRLIVWRAAKEQHSSFFQRPGFSAFWALPNIPQSKKSWKESCLPLMNSTLDLHPYRMPNVSVRCPLKMTRGLKSCNTDYRYIQ